MVRWLLPHRGGRSAAFRACGGQSIRGPGIASATLARLSSYQGSADVMTLPYAEVIGDPIAHSKSPLIHGFWLAKLGIDAAYRRTLVRPRSEEHTSELQSLMRNSYAVFCLKK